MGLLNKYQNIALYLKPSNITAWIENKGFNSERLFRLLLIVIFGLKASSCKKLVEVDAPITSTTESSVYANDATAIAVLTGVYTNLSSGSFAGGTSSISVNAALSADELVLYNGLSTASSLTSYYLNALSNLNTGGADFWYQIYPKIFVVNSAIEGISKSGSLTPRVKQQLLGEAKFLRAFFYFYLVNLYGDVPLVTSTDYKLNAVYPRTPIVQVYEQIINDLKDAQGLLANEYLDGTVVNTTSDRLRPNKWAATALLARSYLYVGDYVNAEIQATSVISNTSLYSLSSLNDIFLTNSSEAIWQLQPVNFGKNTEDGFWFIIPETGLSDDHPAYLNENLLNSFEAGDQRKIDWISKYTDTIANPNVDYYYPYKYKEGTFNNPVTEYLMVLRLAEQFLIRSEARAQQGNISGSGSDLNVIRNRAGLANTTATAQSSLLTAIQHERQVELFTEWGHRWFDLKRSNTIDAIMAVVTQEKGGTWNSNRKWYPIPMGELEKNPHLVQNKGY